MSAESPVLIRTWRVGERTATLTVPNVHSGQTKAALIEWHPNTPAKLTADELAQYRRGRNAALAELTRELGGNALVLEA